MSHYYTDDSIQQLAGNQKIYHQKLNLKIINLLIKVKKKFLEKQLTSSERILFVKTEILEKIFPKCILPIVGVSQVQNRVAQILNFFENEFEFSRSFSSLIIWKADRELSNCLDTIEI